MTAHTAAVRGVAALRAIRLAGAPAMFDHNPADDGGACWTIPLHAITDVVAAAERLGGKATFAAEALF